MDNCNRDGSQCGGLPHKADYLVAGRKAVEVSAKVVYRDLAALMGSIGKLCKEMTALKNGEWPEAEKVCDTIQSVFEAQATACVAVSHLGVMCYSVVQVSKFDCGVDHAKGDSHNVHKRSEN